MSKFLTNELDELVSANIISVETAQQIRNYYQQKKAEPSNRFIVVLGILGSLLVGFGIVLLVAHNWDEFSRTIQTVFAFLPIAVGQGLCLYSLSQKNANRVWKESSSLILFFGVGSCIALIGQIYHVSESLSDFLVTWILLTVGLVYIMGSSVVGLLLIAISTWYACLIGYADIFTSGASPVPYLYVLFLLLIGADYYKHARSNRSSNFFHLYNWFLSISVAIALGTFAANDYSYRWIFVGYVSLFGLYYLLGNENYFRYGKLFANPFLIIGALGMIIVMLIWSFDLLWNELNDDRSDRNLFVSPLTYIIAFLLIAGIVVILRQWKHSYRQIDPIALFPYVFLAAIILFVNSPGLGVLIANLWILIVALFYIRKGSTLNHLGVLNFGLLIIATLAVLRFFDDSIPFVWRGLFFLATGIGFFVANYLLLKKRKSLIKNLPL